MSHNLFNSFGFFKIFILQSMVLYLFITKKIIPEPYSKSSSLTTNK